MPAFVLVRLVSFPWSAVVAGAALCAALAGCGTPYSSRERVTLTAPAAAQQTLLVRNEVGRVVVTADPAAHEVRAEVVKIGKGSVPSEADAALGQIVVKLAAAGEDSGVIEAAAEHPGGNGFRNYEVEWRLTAPPGTTLDVYTRVGKVVAEGFSAEATLKTDVGSIRASGAYTGLSACTGVGDIYAESSGRIDIRTDVGDTVLRVLPGEVRDIKARTQVGELTVDVPEGRTGKFKADTDVGDLRINLDALSVRAGNSDHVEADLGGASSPMLDLSTDVGELTVRSYPPADVARFQ